VQPKSPQELVKWMHLYISGGNSGCTFMSLSLTSHTTPNLPITNDWKISSGVVNIQVPIFTVSLCHYVSALYIFKLLKCTQVCFVFVTHGQFPLIEETVLRTKGSNPRRKFFRFQTAHKTDQPKQKYNPLEGRKQVGSPLNEQSVKTAGQCTQVLNQ